MNQDRLKEIETRAGVATEGPWQANGTGVYVAMMSIKDDLIEKYVSAPGAACCWSDPDIDFIVHARVDVPDLVVEVRRLRASLQKIMYAAMGVEADIFYFTVASKTLASSLDGSNDEQVSNG